MADKIIKGASIVANDWQVVTENVPTALPEGKIAVPLATWQQHGQALLSREQIPGLVLQPGDEISLPSVDVCRIPLIIIMFPAFTDGRGFSMATKLREESGYRGEIRAKGHFIRDQLYYLKRCGFDSFEFDSPVNLTEAVKSLSDFTNDYQRSANQPEPLFRRRH